MIELKLDTKEFEKSLDNLAKKQMPFAASKAMNDTANDVKRALEAQLPKKLDRPTPFSQRAFGIKRSSKRKLTVSIFIKDIQAEYLKYMVEGGTRYPKRTAHAVPVNLRTNKYGNIAGNRGGKKIAALLAKPNTFEGTIKGVRGIWQRNRGGVKLLIAYEPKAEYEPRFPFYKIARGVIRNNFHRNLKRAFEMAMRTAR